MTGNLYSNGHREKFGPIFWDSGGRTTSDNAEKLRRCDHLISSNDPVIPTTSSNDRIKQSPILHRVIELAEMVEDRGNERSVYTLGLSVK